MIDNVSIFPTTYQDILEDIKKNNFDQSSEPKLGSLLSTFVASKPGGYFIELGTGGGLSTAWMLHGMDLNSTLTTIDTDANLVSIAKNNLAQDSRVTFIIGDAEQLIINTEPNSIDFIFADAWPGKYSHVAETLALLKVGGVYLVDDMNPRASWPEGHADKADGLIHYLESRDDFLLTKLAWSSGIMICTRKT